MSRAPGPPGDDPGWHPVPAGEGWVAGALLPAVAVTAGSGPPPLPPDLERIVADTWAEAVRRRPALFNGRVFSVERIGPATLAGHWTEYRRVLAQLQRPELHAALRLRPLAVNGLVECDDALVLGKRQADAVYMPARWQAAPSGNVEDRGDGAPLDLAAQLLAELREELGVGRDHVGAIVPVLAIEHAGTHVVDVGFLVRVSLPFAVVAALHAATGNREYDALLAVAPGGTASLPREVEAALLPSARALLEVRAARPRPD